jgi:hypothetical protein
MMTEKLIVIINLSYPLTHIQRRLNFKLLELQQIASNLPDTFTDYNCVTKSFNPAINAPCPVEVSIKTTPPQKGQG